MTLKEYIQTSGLTATQLFEDLNAKTEEQLIPIDTNEIKRYLIMADLWLPINAALDNPNPQIAGLAKTVLDTLSTFSVLRYNIPTIKAKVDYMLSALLQIGLLTAQAVTDIQNMGTEKISKVSQFGFRRIDIFMIKELLL